MSSLEFCSGQSDSGTPSSLLPSSVSTVSVLDVGAPPTATTVALSQRPGFFLDAGTAGVPAAEEEEEELVPSATQTAEPT